MNVELYHDPGHNVLVYRGGPSENLIGKVPGAKLASPFVVLPDSLYARQMARWLDLPAPPPMAAYDYPRNRDLAPRPTEAQMAMANFCALHPKCFNLSDMGTMKTLATLWAADFIMSQFPPGECRALIVAPLSILQRVWGDALACHLVGRRTFEIVHGSSAEARRRALARRADFYIINFDGLAVGAQTKRKLQLGGLSKDLSDRTDIRIAIIDEASAYRDRRTRRHRLARVLVAQRDYLWLLSATPTSSSPADAYGLGKLVNDCYGESYTAFHRRTMVQLGPWKFVPAVGGYKAAARLLQPAIRFDIKDVWDGPELTTQARDVELTPNQKKMLATLKRDSVIEFKHEEGTQVQALPNEAVIRNKALQIILGAVYDKDHVAWKTDATHRINELIDCITEATKKVLVFVPLTAVLNMLHHEIEFAEKGPKIPCIRLNGEVPASERNALVSAFKNDDRIRVAIADPGVVAFGFNEFVEATTVVWYGPTEKPELYIQGNKRAHRPGQRYPVSIVHLAASALEREIFRRLTNNERMQGVMLDWIKRAEI